MDKLTDIADNRHQLLSEFAKDLAVREGEFVADIIAPGISKPDFVLGAFENASEPAQPVSDILGQDMVPNYLDTYNKMGLEQFQMEDHELRGRLSNNLRASFQALGMNDDQIDQRVVNQLVRNLRTNYELQVLDAIGTTNNYASGLTVNVSTKWDSTGDPMHDVQSMLMKLAEKGAPTATVYLVADPATWAAIRQNANVKGVDVNGVNRFYSEDDLAKILAGQNAHAVVARQLKGSTFAMAGKLAIVCRPEIVASDSSCAWRTVYNTTSNGPEPYVYRFSEPGTEHRGYTIGCALDRKLCGTGNNSQGKQIWGALCYNALT